MAPDRSPDMQFEDDAIAVATSASSPTTSFKIPMRPDTALDWCTNGKAA